jgi:hypothetical protein
LLNENAYSSFFSSEKNQNESDYKVSQKEIQEFQARKSSSKKQLFLQSNSSLHSFMLSEEGKKDS